MIGVVERPVAVQKPALGLQPRKRRRAGQRCEQVKRGCQELVFHDEFQGAIEDVGAVAIEAEYEAAVDHDARVVETATCQRVVRGRVHQLVAAPHVGRRERLEAHKQAAATGLVGRVEVAGIAGHVERSGGLPDDARAAEYLEQRPGVTPIGQQVVVQKEHQAVVHEAQFTFDLGHGARFIVRRPPEAALVAEIAGMGAAARRDHRVADEVGARIHQIAAGNRHPCGRAFALPPVEPLELPALEVLENLAPDRLGRPDAHRVGVRGGLLGHARRMQTAEHDLGATLLPALSQLVGPRGRGDVGLNAHQVHVAVQLRGFHVFVAENDLPVVGREAGQGHQAQRGKLGILDEPVVCVAGPLHGCQDQQKSAFHGFSPAEHFA